MDVVYQHDVEQRVIDLYDRQGPIRPGEMSGKGRMLTLRCLLSFSTAGLLLSRNHLDSIAQVIDVRRCTLGVAAPPLEFIVSLLDRVLLVGQVEVLDGGLQYLF